MKYPGTNFYKEMSSKSYNKNISSSTLDQSSEEERCIIEGFTKNCPAKTRNLFIRLGLIKGCKVVNKGYSPGNDLIIILYRGAKIALRKEDVKYIFINPIYSN